MKKYSILLIVILLCLTIVNGAWYDFLNPLKPTMDETQYDECVSNFGEELCASEYCNGNLINMDNKIVHCTYPRENRRTFVTELYPNSCDALNNWNETEEVQFKFAVNVDHTSSLSSGVCQGQGDFPRTYSEEPYKMPVQVTNAVKSRQEWWIDMFGNIYIEKPSKADLEDLYINVLRNDDAGFSFSDFDSYGDGIDYIYNNLKKIPMNDQIFNLLKCEVDCDYTGVNDNDLNLPVTSDGKKGGLQFDFTKASIYYDLNQVDQWKDKNLASLGEACGFWASIWPFHECVQNYNNNVDLINYYTIIDRLDLDSDYMYRYSDKNDIYGSYTCSYPKGSYSDQEITTRVTCSIGKTWENIFFNSDISDYNWDILGLDNCKNNEGVCQFSMDLTFNLNSSIGNVQYISHEQNNYNLTIEEESEQWVDKTKDLLQYLLKDKGIIEVEEKEKQTFETYVGVDQNMIDVMDGSIEITTFIFSFILIIAYVINISMLGGILQLIVNSFFMFKNAFIDMFELRRR